VATITPVVPPKTTAEIPPATMSAPADPKAISR
jgi:hypothetical protein